MDRPAPDAIGLDAGAPLTWHAGAPLPSFFLKDGNWRLGEGFSISHLRARTPDDKPVCVRRNDQGQAYYRPHWVAITALMDAISPLERAAAARQLAQLDPLMDAAELGLGSALAFHLLTGYLPGPDGKLSRAWQDEGPWTAYFKALPPASRARLAQAQVQDWGLLELALRLRLFGVAEQLWDAGCRFCPALQAQGMDLWILVEPAREAAPAAAFDQAWRRNQRQTEFLKKLVAQEREGAPGRLADTASSKGLESTQACLLLLKRWLDRAVDHGACVNQTHIVEGTISGDPKPQRAERTAFMHALAGPPQERMFFPEWAQIWVEAMERAGYRFSAPLNDPFVANGQAATLPEYLQAMGVDACLVARVGGLVLKERLEPCAARPPARL